MSFEDRLLAEILDRHSAIISGTEPVSAAGPRRRRVLAGAGALLLAGAGLSVGVLSIPSRVASTSGMVLDAKVVVTRTTRALDNLGPSIEYTRTRYLNSTGSSATWVYRDRMRQVDYLGMFSAPSDSTSTTGKEVKGKIIKGTFVVEKGIVIDYVHHVWSHVVLPAAIGLSLSDPAAFLADQVRQELAAGQLKVVRKVTLNGKQTIEVAGDLPAKGGPVPDIIWIDPVTYLPVQEEVDQAMTEYEWLPPVKANLSQLTTPVPAGFIQLAGISP